MQSQYTAIEKNNLVLMSQNLTVQIDYPNLFSKVSISKTDLIVLENLEPTEEHVEGEQRGTLSHLGP